MQRLVILLLFTAARGLVAFAAPPVSVAVAACQTGPQADTTTVAPRRTEPVTRASAERSGTIEVQPGVRLRYVERGAPEASRTVLFVHGYPDSSYSFDGLMSRFDPAVRTVAFDLRGFGDSSRPACCYTPRDFADDVIRFMDARKIRTATLVGHSMGSLISQVVAIHYPDRVDDLVLIGSATTADNQVVRDFLGAVKELNDPIDRRFVHEFQASTVHTPIEDARLARYVDESMKAPARVWIETLSALVTLDTRPDLRRIRARTLVIFGDRDNLFGRDDQEALVRGIPHVTLTVYEGVGHSVQWEQPERVAADITAFIRGDLISQR